MARFRSHDATFILPSENWIGMTDAQIVILEESWVRIARDKVRCGYELFVLFFHDYPANRFYFSFYDASAETTDMERLESHGALFMDTFEQFLINIRNQKAFIKLVHENADVHRRFVLPTTSYDELRNTFLKIVGRSMKKRKKGSDEVLEVWTSFLKRVFRMISNDNTRSRYSTQLPQIAGDPSSESTISGTSKSSL